MFSLWAIARGILFFPRQVGDDGEFANYDLTSKIYILMKRLNQHYDSILRMDSVERDKFFTMEMQLMKEEAEQAKKSNQ